MRKCVTMVFAAAIGVAATLGQQALAQQASAVRLLPLVKALHLRIMAPPATVPAPCRTFAGAFAGQFSDGPYANLIITDVTAGPDGCVFRGTYGWGAYPADPKPGTADVGPGTFLEAKMAGRDLRLGDTGSMGMVVHPDLRADFYSQGSLVSRAAFTRIPAAALN
ncbi:MAG TPA: hypothetical protein VH020_03950 [Stellaceae bacterium]|jgi:hypothetical protein|nr:hypothetical protein [Stellaceae bacterium]